MNFVKLHNFEVISYVTTTWNQNWKTASNGSSITPIKYFAFPLKDGPYVEDFIKQWTEGLQSTLVKAKQVRSSELKQIYDATKILFEIHYLKMDSHKNNSILPAVLQAVDRANRENFDDLRHWISSGTYSLKKIEPIL